MLVVETIARIRRAHLVDGKSIKAICRELKISRKVVRKVLRSGATAFEYERSVQPLPRIGPFKDQLDRILASNETKAARERLTLIRVFEELRGLGYEGGYDAVRRYARGWRCEQVSSSAAAFVPLSFAPGEAYQFDWSHDVVLINGVTVTVKVAHVRLCHSRMLFVRAYPRDSQEMVFDAHDRAFAFFKGTCTRGIYDNMKTAVETILVGKERVYNRRFLQMCGHYLVDPVACTPASGWEKGQVENQVGLVRERFFTPRLRVKSYDELNALLLDKAIAYARAHRHPEFRDRTIWEAFETERPSLVPYAGRFDGFHAVPASVSKTCLVRFDNNRYSVMANAVGRPVEIRAYADHIELRQDGRMVGEHPRCFGRDQTIFDPWHYVPVLARKPGALRNGAPFKDWVLPAGIDKIRRRLAGINDGNRQMVSVLTAVLQDGLPAVASVFRTYQGWTALTRQGPKDGTLRVVPIAEGIAYVLLRALQDDVPAGELCGAAPGRALGIRPEWHAEMIAGSVSIPEVQPGDTVWWHTDICHSVADEHAGKEYASVIYIGSAPDCAKNRAYQPGQQEAFLANNSQPR